jgi:hypothetical protein
VPGGLGVLPVVRAGVLLELGDQRVIAYTLMRKAMIATESGNPALGVGIANSALADGNALTPRLRAVILRQHPTWATI